MSKLDSTTEAMISLLIALVIIVIITAAFGRIFILMIKMKKISTNVKGNDAINNLKNKYNLNNLQIKKTWIKLGTFFKFDNEKSIIAVTNREKESDSLSNIMMISLAFANIVDYKEKRNELRWQYRWFGILCILLLFFTIIPIILWVVVSATEQTSNHQNLVIGSARYAIRFFAISGWIMIAFIFFWWSSMMDTNKGYMIDILKQTGISKEDLLKTKWTFNLIRVLPLSIPLYI